MLVDEEYIIERIDVDERELGGYVSGVPLKYNQRSRPSSETASTPSRSSRNGRGCTGSWGVRVRTAERLAGGVHAGKLRFEDGKCLLEECMLAV